MGCGSCDASATCQGGSCVPNCVEEADATACSRDYGCDYQVVNNCGRVVQCGERCINYKFDCHCGPGACVWSTDPCQ